MFHKHNPAAASKNPIRHRTFNNQRFRVALVLIGGGLIAPALSQNANAQTASIQPCIVETQEIAGAVVEIDVSIAVSGFIHSASGNETLSVIRVEGKRVPRRSFQVDRKRMNRRLSLRFVLSNGKDAAAVAPLYPGVYVQEFSWDQREPAPRRARSIRAPRILRGRIPAIPSAVPARRYPYGSFNFRVSFGGAQEEPSQ